MADFSLPPPPPFLALPGEPPIPWPRWLQSFETYLIMAGLTEVSAARKKALLQHCLGAEGQRVLGTISDTGENTYEQSVTALNEHFAAPQSVLLLRFIFRRRHQLPGESVHQYVANLRGLANSCKFGGLHDEMIRDQLIEHTSDNKIRETLLLQPDDLTLSRAIAVAVLSQVQEGVEKPIAFASQALNPTEQRYSVGEREALSCLCACERWHLYLYGRHFTLRTDHHALVTLLATSGAGHRPLSLHRWYDRLRQYNYSLQFTPGRENVVADLLFCSVPAPEITEDFRPDTDIIQLLHTSAVRGITTGAENCFRTGPCLLSAPHLHPRRLALTCLRRAEAICPHQR
ncbi:Retrovirus-related Pol polyprotein from transposon opus [Anabarilius grahami]|uniref:Retrovirus-related Pol polyprotein from transposon opus n=1 Tax=Anabarilius grahami TaxID=495550 RepID=A0A3N0YX08_ANAGA|nr:Retrovirus-related Pol polyprotein from transposon opus [Anabarilius grahami]